MYEAEYLMWVVHVHDENINLESDSHEDELKERGFIFTHDDTHAFAVVEATLKNNQSTLQCREFIVGTPTTFTPEASLNVVGEYIHV